MASLFEVLGDVTFSKKGDLITSENRKDYPAYLVNRFLSDQLEYLVFANEMNALHFLPPEVQYQYMIHSLRKKKCYLKFAKSVTNEQIDTVAEYYGISTAKAERVLGLHTPEQLEYMKMRIDMGGTS